MCFFRNKISDKVKEDRELIEFNSRSIDAIIVLAKDNDEFINELKALQGKLKYLIPSEKSKIFDFDKTIKNKIGDLRIVLTKSDGEVTNKATDILLDMKLAVADRNAKL